ncbi:zinc finger protein 436 [Orussus abietinus]|uniref:zinc finger protein 436 n=1 Tax=Orussus abietinus TaxID=222816 RepID=UPI00062623D8|nr:zinc finger protein 436 [Orussus abietinus]
MAYDPRNVKYPPNVHSQQHPQTNMTGYPYGSHPVQHGQRTDENRNENGCGNKEMCTQSTHQSSGTQTIQKVDAATMTDPLQIDFRLTSEYLARCSSTLGLPYVSKYEENSNTSSHNCQEVRPKIEFEVEPQHINGMLVYQCPECAYRFEDREALHEHLEDHRQRPHICDICGASLKRKEHLDRHKQGHNKDRPYRCNMCCKAFKRNEHLARHVIIHSGSKNQVCTECGKAFYRKDHLKKHLQSHSSSRNKPLNPSQNNQGAPGSSEEALGGFAMMMRQAGPPPFSILRT